MRDGGSADTAFGADDRDDTADRLGVRRREQTADRAHDVEGADRPNQVVADAPSRQFAIERDVVDAADHDHARAGVADFGKLIELVEDVVAALLGLDKDDVRRRRRTIGLDRRGGAAHLDFDMRLGEPAIFAGRLDCRGGFNRLAKGLDRYAGRRRDMFVGGLGHRGLRRRFEFGDCDLLCVLDHLPRSLILPVS